MPIAEFLKRKGISPPTTAEIEAAAKEIKLVVQEGGKPSLSGDDLREEVVA